MKAARGNLPDIMLQNLISAPRPGAAQMAMTMANGSSLQRICICAAPGRGANGNDNSKWQSFYLREFAVCAAPGRGAHCN
eukprot:4323079-Karenia_brevis.AAC.1